MGGARSAPKKFHYPLIISSFRTAQFNQQDFFYGYKERRLEDQKRAVWRHKNKQYQWLLAEAYELFEDFIESAYGFAGFYRPKFLAF